MSQTLEGSTGLTANFASTGYANSAGANAQVLTAVATTLSINGVIYNFAIRASAVFASLNDGLTGVPAVPIPGGKAAIVVVGVNTAGALVFVQGPVVPHSGSAGGTILPLPSVPNGVCPIAYQVIKNNNAAGAAPWTFGSSLFNAANVSFEPAVQLCQMPNAGIVNATA